jgi:hypothetical protein
MSPSAENPLSRPDLFRRITHEPRHYLTKVLIEENLALGITWETPEYAEIQKNSPAFSLMVKDEVDALLSRDGATWFVCQATGLDRFEVSRLLAAGTPWPLRSIEDDKIWSAGPFDERQVHFLSQLFQPTKRLNVIVSELSVNYWKSPDEPDGGPVKQARVYWEHVAEEVGSDVETVKRVAIALHVYHCCLQSFTKQWHSDRKP